MHASRPSGPFGARSPAGATDAPAIPAAAARTRLRDLGDLFGAAGGYAQIALLELEADHPAREAVEMLARVLWRAQNASHDLAGEGPVEPRRARPTDLCRVAREAAAIAEGLAPAGSAVQLELPSEPVPVRADDGALVRQLVRLVRGGLEGLDGREGRVELAVEPPQAPGGGGALRLRLPPVAG